MDPRFNLAYSEYESASMLAEYFKHKAGYSLFVPMSRQEKGVDLLLVKRVRGNTQCVSIQVKASRSYRGVQPKRKTTKKPYSHNSWFQTFKVAQEADFFLFFILYPTSKENVKSTKWDSVILVFTREEMEHFFNHSLRNTRSGHKDTKFGFGFDSPHAVYLTRGVRDDSNELIEFSHRLLANRTKDIEKAFVREG